MADVRHCRGVKTVQHRSLVQLSSVLLLEVNGTSRSHPHSLMLILTVSSIGFL
uniref:Uncharacterized protein n=1 Tax=Anguilla anguilla TaxID=7936 RepID=A0A0E9QCT5_ANGAN